MISGVFGDFVSVYKRLQTNITESKRLSYESCFFLPTSLHRQSTTKRLALTQREHQRDTNMYVKQLNNTVMKSLRNSVQLIGRLGKDPEVKVFGDKKKASFSIATTDSYKNAKGEKVEDTQWHNIVIWGSLASVAEKYLKKGQEVCVEGKLVHRNYETTEGEKRYITEINVNDLLMLGSK
jgi:single-strand DNA-binding protein